SVTATTTATKLDLCGRLRDGHGHSLASFGFLPLSSYEQVGVLHLSRATLRRTKIRQCNANQADALPQRIDRPDQAKSDFEKAIFAVNRELHGSTARRLLEINPFDFDRHRDLLGYRPGSGNCLQVFGDV